MKIRNLSLALLLFFCLSSISKSIAQQQENLKIIAKFDSVNRAMPREKMYVHLDKNVYSTIDTLWFKAYLFDASLKSASIQSGLIYAEIADAKGSPIKTISLPTGGGLTWGGFALDPKIYSSGTYTFRAYTNWMQNFGDRYLFKKEIRIINLSDAEPATNNGSVSSAVGTTTKPSTSNTARQNGIDVQFLPEGGTWIADQPQVMAFKAINLSGNGVVVQGNIVDSKQNKVASFIANQKGMGIFTMTPKLGETYTAIFSGAIAIKSEQLPKAQQNGINLQVKNSFSSDSLTITVNSTLSDTELTLMGQSRGLISFVVKIKANIKSKKLTLNKNIFPSGISQITIFNTRNQGIAERSFFINHGDQLQISTNVGSTTYGVRDSIPVKLFATNAGGIPIIGSFSIAVTDDSQVLKDSVNNNNILSYLLLTSDVKGEIEDPGSYFNNFNEQKHNDLEALVLTQGWTSYFMKPVEKKLFKVEKDFNISGKVTNLTNRPIAKANVSLMGKNRNKIISLQTVANEKGEFVFENLPALDSTSVVIQALTPKDRKGTLGVEVNEFKRPPFAVAAKNVVYIAQAETEEKVKNMINDQKEVAVKRDGISLNTVNIVAKKIVKNSKNLNGPGEADQIIDEVELEKAPQKTLYDLLYEKVPGFVAKSPRGSSSREFFIKNNRLKVIIDGMDVDYFYSPMDVIDDHFRYVKSYLDGYKASDIMGIEVMTSLYNTNNYDIEFNSAANMNAAKGFFSGYLEITTRSGSGPFLKKSANVYLYRPYPYGDFKVFYSPKYNSTNKANKTPDLRSTVYWVPNLITNEKGEAKTSFFSTDKKGTYTLWVEGTDMRGNIGMKAVTLKIN
jgi:hypothetical protein